MNRFTLLFKWLLIACVIGPLGGLTVIVFKRIATSGNAELYIGKGTLFYLLPIGGSAVVALIYLVVPRASGEGMPIYVESVREGNKRLPFSGTVAHFLAAAVVLASGGSGGMVGPMSRVCSGLGQEVSRVFPQSLLGKTVVRRATICGAAAGIGGILGAPITGGLFAVEILYADGISYVDVFPAMLASATSFLVVSSQPGWERFLGNLEHAGSVDLVFLPALLVLAVVVSGAGAFFSKFFKACSRGLERHVETLSIRVLAGTALLAATAGIFGYVGRASLGAGTQFIREITAGGLPAVRGMPQAATAAGAAAGILVLLALCKILTTTFTVGSGLTAGLTYPSILVGASLGAAGSHIAAMFTQVNIQTHYAFVACGVAAMLASVMNIPLTATVLVGELFGLEHSFVAIIGSVTAFALAKRVVIYPYKRREEEI